MDPSRSKRSKRPDRTGAAEGEPTHGFDDKSRGVRLQKAMAEAGVASRRACEQMIEQGRVTVNGQLVPSLPAWVDPSQDRIAIDGRAVRPKPGRRTSGGVEPAGADAPRKRASCFTYVLLHKPKGVISTASDPEGRRTVLDLVELPKGMNARLFPVGRLDADSTGLLLLTDDGELAQRLTHPKFGVAKTYRVTVKGRLETEQIDRLRRGVHLASETEAGSPESRGAPPGSAKPSSKRAAFDRIEIVRRDRNPQGDERTVLQITLREGQNREIRRVLARLGLKVRKLTRIGLGPVNLKGVGVGRWRLLHRGEVEALFNASRPETRDRR